jgi:hypothetical protein
MRTHGAVLDQEFLVIRGRILEVAAALDRLDRAPESAAEEHDPRMDLVRRAVDVLSHPDPDRAETIQRLFSIDYQPEWLEGPDAPERRD